MCTLRIIACLLISMLGVAASAVQEERLIEEDPGFIEEGDPGEGSDGAVSLSDGSLLRGRLSFSTGRKLRVFDVRHRRVFYLDPASIRGIRTLVEEENLEEAWAFEEEGFRRKVKLGWRYPIRKYRQEIQLAGGQLIEGHCYAAVIYVDDGTREHKVILPRVQKGKRGQKLADLVYPRSVLLGASPRVSSKLKRRTVPFASVDGELRGLSALTFTEIRSEKGYPAAVRSGGTFHAGGLLPGAYSVFLRRGRDVSIGLPEGGAPEDLDREGIEERIGSLAEFSDEKRVVFIGGRPERPWVLLELRRLGKTTLRSEGGPARVLRWELWVLARGKRRWSVASRVFLDRQLISAGRPFPKTAYRRDRRLSELGLKPGKNDLPATE